MEQIIVGISDCQIGSEPAQTLTTYALGSCIAVTAFDPDAGIGGLLHYMLPDSAIDRAAARANPYRFADTGIPLLIEKACRKGASRRRLIVAAAGAAQMLDPENVFDIGRRNYAALRKILWKAGLLLQAEAIGGTTSRNVRLDLGSGRVLLQEGGKERELMPARPGKGVLCGVPGNDR
jgi:chemotaxis protein CheD